jgi:Zn-finger nucleic acid-binding protein
VKVDVCSSCGGMWLDAGELDLLRQVQKSGSGNILKSFFDFRPAKSSVRK